jgi:Family of unknown function (DUF6116)
MATLPNKKERQGLLRRYLSSLSFPKLFLLLGGLFALDLFIPDPIPFMDEAVLGILTVMVGMLRGRAKTKETHATSVPGEPRAKRPQLGD